MMSDFRNNLEVKWNSGVSESVTNLTLPEYCTQIYANPRWDRVVGIGFEPIGVSHETNIKKLIPFFQTRNDFSVRLRRGRDAQTTVFKTVVWIYMEVWIYIWKNFDGRVGVSCQSYHHPTQSIVFENRMHHTVMWLRHGRNPLSALTRFEGCSFFSFRSLHFSMTYKLSTTNI